MFPTNAKLMELVAAMPPLADKPIVKSARQLEYEKIDPNVVWAKPSITTKIWSRVPEYGSQEELDAQDRRLCRSIDQDPDSFMVLVGAFAADGTSKWKEGVYSIQQGGVNIPWILRILDSYLITHRALYLNVSHVTTFAGKRVQGNGIVNVTAGTRLAYSARLNLAKWPKFATRVLEVDPKNVAKHMKNPKYLVGFHGGDGTQAVLYNTFKNGGKGNYTVSQRVERQYAEAFAKEIGGRLTNRKVIHPTPDVCLRKAESIRHILRIYEGVTEDMPVHPVKFEQFLEMKDFLQQELTKIESKALKKSKSKVQGAQLATTPSALEAPSA